MCLIQLSTPDLQKRVNAFGHGAWGGTWVAVFWKSSTCESNTYQSVKELLLYAVGPFLWFQKWHFFKNTDSWNPSPQALIQ